jgi:hypothetical protein
LAWFVAILGILFLTAGAALAYVVGAAAVLAFITVAVPLTIIIIFIHLIARLIGSEAARPADRN